MNDKFSHWDDAELLNLLGIYARIYRTSALAGTRFDAEARRKLYHLCLAAHERGLRLAR